MKIVLLMGSPNSNSSSAHLAENLIRGAKEKGHTELALITFGRHKTGYGEISE